MNTVGLKTHFSMGQSILKPKEAVKILKERGYDTVCMSDVYSLSGMTDIIKAAKENEMNYVIGVSVVIYPNLERVKHKPLYTLKLFVKNQEGLENLFDLLSAAGDEDHFYYTQRLCLQDITYCNMDGLICTTGDIDGLFGANFSEKALDGLIERFADDLYVEISAVNQRYYRACNEKAIHYANINNISYLKSRPMLYTNASDDDARDLAQYIASNSSSVHALASKPVTRDFSILEESEFFDQELSAFGGLDIKVVNGEGDFFYKIEYEWKKYDMSLPRFSDTEFDDLLQLCKKGFMIRAKNQTFTQTLNPALLEDYKQRLAYELGVIRNMKFEGYFLLVHYVVDYSKQNGILVGPARGSAAGSLVAYLLGITEVDPLRFGLIFERFLNPDRLDYPDIDLDFMTSRRTEVIEHLIEKFGKDRVAGISNYNTLGSASALRDVGRVSGISPQDYECSKLVPKEHGSNVSLEEAVLQVTEIESYASKYPRQFSISKQLQGVNRAIGQHAAGIVVAGEDIRCRAIVSNNKDIPVLNWDKQIVEDWGLIKLDILGLSTLDILNIAVNKIKDATGLTLDLNNIPLNDEKALSLFAQGKTKGIFQFEGGQARKLCREVAVGGEFNFKDVVAINALNRPGPLDAGLTERYVKIRQGRFNATYPHPKAENALRETHGVMVYQEQIMQMTRDLCGFSMSEADTLRKAIGKKSADLMKTMKDRFVSGAVANKMMLMDAESLWDQIEMFAAYSFNKSHAVAYSLISMQAAYVKANHPLEFYAATMSVLDDEKVRMLAKEATSSGYLIMPPDINKSTDVFEVHYDLKRCVRALYSPLTSVKNVSTNGAKHIVEMRKLLPGGFESINHFIECTESRKCNSRARDSLIKVGAFASVELESLDALHPDRIKDQKELMGALSVSDVKPDRVIDMSPCLISNLSDLYADLSTKCGQEVVSGNSGKKPKFVVITDKPTFFEIQDGKSFSGKSTAYIKSALKEAGLKPSEGYFTHLVKVAPESKEISREEIALHGDFLKRELALLNAPLVVLAGTKTMRYFFPDMKGSAEEMSGITEYVKDEDRTYVVCINPQMVYIKPAMQDLLNTVFKEVSFILDLS